jgi:hypothetical protein
MVTPDETASASPSASEQFPGLAAGLNELIDDARGRAKSMRFYVKFWQVIDVLLGLLAATLAAENIEAVINELLRRRVAILNMDHQAIPVGALGGTQ